MHVKTKLEEQIQIQRVVLNELKKQSQLKASTEKTAAQKKKADEEEELDVDALLEDLKQNMINVYGYLPASGGKDL